MTNTNKTLYIPLYGKAKVSRMGIILSDKKAEEIWDKEGFVLKGKAKSKWLAYYMSMRGKVFDIATVQRLEKLPDSTVLHIGCGMDSRVCRINCGNKWYDMEFDEVITERRKYFSENDHYKMLSADARKPQEWLHNFEKDSTAVVIMEGVTMYIEKEMLKNLILQLQQYFSQIIFIADFYTTFGVKASKYKNPIKSVGASVCNGMDSAGELVFNDKITVVREWEMTPQELINEIQGTDRIIFRKIFAGSFAKKIYRMYEYHITK